MNLFTMRRLALQSVGAEAKRLYDVGWRYDERRVSVTGRAAADDPPPRRDHAGRDHRDELCLVASLDLSLIHI